MVLETKLNFFFFPSFFLLFLSKLFFFFLLFFVCVSERILCIPVCRGVSGSRRSAWIIWTISSTVFRFSWKEGQWCWSKGNDRLLFVGVLKKTAHECTKKSKDIRSLSWPQSFTGGEPLFGSETPRQGMSYFGLFQKYRTCIFAITPYVSLSLCLFFHSMIRKRLAARYALV